MWLRQSNNRRNIKGTAWHFVKIYRLRLTDFLTKKIITKLMALAEAKSQPLI